MSSHTFGLKTLGARGFINVSIKSRLRSIGLSERDAYWITSHITKWYRSSGISWTIAHLKNLRMSVLHTWGQTDVVIPWIAIKQGLPSVYYALRKYSRSKILKVLVAYKAFEFSVPSPDQVKKFTQAVSRDLVDPLALSKASKYIRDGYIGDESIERRSWKIPALNVMEYPVKQSFSKIGVRGLIPFRHSMKNRGRSKSETVLSVPEYESRAMLLEDAYRCLESGEFSKLLFPYRQALTSPIGGQAMHRPKPSMAELYGNKPPKSWDGKIPEYYESRISGHTGGIAATQEPGGKLRVFASPFPVLQAALHPLEVVLDELEQLLPTDFRYDQEKGAHIVQDYLVAHPLRHVYCFDLSNATDMFPLSLQTDWMRACTSIRVGQIDLFEKVSKGTFLPDEKLVSAGFPSELRWTIGQPLGTRGSFQSFSLTHNFLIRGIEKSIHGYVQNQFVVLGDDVVIFDFRVAEEYTAIMASLGVNIAKEKSIVSYTSAEFAGYFIERDMMSRAGKNRATSSSNIRSQAQALGRTSKEEIMSVMNNHGLVDLFGRLPKSVGGFGWTTNQSLGSALETDITLSTLATVLAEVPEEIFHDLTKSDTLNTAAMHVCGILGFSLRDLKSLLVESPAASMQLGKTFVRVPPKVLDTMAYNFILYRKQSLVREAYAHFGDDTATRDRFVISQGRILDNIQSSILSRYFLRPGVILDTPEKVVLEIAYNEAKVRLEKLNKSQNLPLVIQLGDDLADCSVPSETGKNPPDVPVLRRSSSQLSRMSEHERKIAIANLPKIGMNFRSEPTRYLTSLCERYTIDDLCDHPGFKQYFVKAYMDRVKCDYPTALRKLGLTYERPPTH